MIQNNLHETNVLVNANFTNIQNSVTSIQNEFNTNIQNINNQITSTKTYINNQIEITKLEITKQITQITTEMNVNITQITNQVTNIEKTVVVNIEQEFNKKVEILNKQIVNVQNTVIQQTTELVHNTVIHAAGNASKCCDDCKKPEFRVPPVSACMKAGCQKGCAYQNSTCDGAGEEMPPCLFPVKYQGKVHDSCMSMSDHGETKRPFCFTASEANKAKFEPGASADHLVDWAFCDCTRIVCECPKGEKLGEDGKSCGASKATPELEAPEETVAPEPEETVDTGGEGVEEPVNCPTPMCKEPEEPGCKLLPTDERREDRCKKHPCGVKVCEPVDGVDNP